MSDQPTYGELVLRCQRLANIIVRNNRGTEELLRAEVKKAKAEAWEEGYNNGWGDGRTDSTVDDYNPYKEKP